MAEASTWTVSSEFQAFLALQYFSSGFVCVLKNCSGAQGSGCLERRPQNWLCYSPVLGYFHQHLHKQAEKEVNSLEKLTSQWHLWVEHSIFTNGRKTFTALGMM